MSNSNLSLRKKVNKRLGMLADKPHAIQGVVGDYSGNVAVPGHSDRVFVRVRGFVTIAEAGTSGYVANAPVLVGYEKRRGHKIYKILGPRGNAGAPTGTGIALPKHHLRHEWNMPGGGDDVVYIDQRQLTQLRVTPGPGLSVYVNVGPTWTGDAWVRTVQAAALDLSWAEPAAGGNYVMIYVDAAGAIGYDYGPEVVPVEAMTYADIPELPVDGYPLAAVRIYAGQTSISESYASPDIIDLRGAALPSVHGTQRLKMYMVTQGETYTPDNQDCVIIINSPTAITLNLPAADSTGRMFIVQNYGAGLVTIDADGADTISGSTTQILVQYECLQLVDFSSTSWIAV